MSVSSYAFALLHMSRRARVLVFYSKKTLEDLVVIRSEIGSWLSLLRMSLSFSLGRPKSDRIFFSAKEPYIQSSLW
ncbi:hypothetical protein COCSADRAFT_330637 [Bipolaris sorokiniana ND90Pr]|uniref:PH domain-containing protein n=1 Tax=Cochliobolus sativus (strain ND90Pr / ATCC 201652) TaxID=665912 RepID=M2S8P2_COCSN|nr:uncharacterized protein COCSADRAFT_330637 [Bipolaris sorokiniana ND90Pr]EMD63693.1 hypothetical protein COCSADRAFT_330637 [Bipolaris sorokiniana ND90Pr]